jgi:hypothetical protein
LPDGRCAYFYIKKMKHFPLLLLCAALSQRCHAQPACIVAGVEKAFARHAREHGMKAAFLRYMDSGSVVFNRGHVLNGPGYWQQAPPEKGVLYWEPVFACTAADERSGFTTGPFEFRATGQDSAIYAGQYTTVWLRNEAGAWHFLADLGITYAPSRFGKQPEEVYRAQLPAPSLRDTSAVIIDLAFNERFRLSPLTAFNTVCLPDTWLNIQGQPPQRGAAALQELLPRLPGLSFSPLAGVMAQSRDLAYVYGYVNYAGRQENYLRVWAHTAGGWKLLLQVLRW